MEFMLQRNGMSKRTNLRGQTFTAVLIRLLFLGMFATIVGAAQGQVVNPTITSFTLNPSSVDGGQTALATITLNFKTNVAIALSSSNPAVASVPATVSAPAGSNTATFIVNTTAVAADTPVVLTATGANVVKVTITVLAPVGPQPVVTSLVLSPSTVLSTDIAVVTSTGTVTVDIPAPVGGTNVILTSTDPNLANVPFRVNIPAGATTATFPITTGSVTANTAVLISARRGNATKSVSLVILHTPAFDFNNDGFNDLFFQNSVTGDVFGVGLNGLTVTEIDALDLKPDPAYKVVGFADFNGDGKPDLIFQNATNGKLELWLLDGVSVQTAQATTLSPGAGYKVVGVGDFNGDGKADLVFQNQTTNQIVIWYMNGATFIGGTSLPFVPAANYKVVGVGDFNKDGQPDLLFQNSSTGQLVVWYMNGPNYIGGAPLSNVPGAGWQVKGVADYDNNGSPDLVFQNSSTNQVVIWFLNGLTFIGGGFISSQPSAPYLLVGPH